MRLHGELVREKLEPRRHLAVTPDGEMQLRDRHQGHRFSDRVMLLLAIRATSVDRGPDAR